MYYEDYCLIVVIANVKNDGTLRPVYSTTNSGGDYKCESKVKIFIVAIVTNIFNLIRIILNFGKFKQESEKSKNVIKN